MTRARIAINGEDFDTDQSIYIPELQIFNTEVNKDSEKYII
jgi:hypothetical protein